MTREYWRKYSGSTWHIAVSSPQHDALSTEPDLYTMTTLCDRQFQRDGTIWKIGVFNTPPKRICKQCAKADALP